MPLRLIGCTARPGSVGPTGGLTRDSRFCEAAEEWIDTTDRQVAQGALSPNTGQLYRLNLTKHVRPGSTSCGCGR